MYFCSEKNHHPNNGQIKYGYFKDLRNAENIDELKINIENIIKNMGFTNFSITNLGCSSQPQLKLNTMPTELTSKYFDKHYFSNDMVLQRPIPDNQPFFSSDILDYLNAAPFISKMTIVMDEINRLNKSFGFDDLYHIPFLDAEKNLLLTVTTEKLEPAVFKKLIEKTESSLDILIDAIKFVLSKSFDGALPQRGKDLKVNKQPLKILAALANNDCDLYTLAKMHNLSQVTINQHLQKIRSIFCTKTNYASIKIAVERGLIPFGEIDEYMVMPCRKSD
jgi:Autoinducer binding domain